MSLPIADWDVGLREGQRLYDAGRFFEAHEVLEEVWRGQTGKRKICAQGLVQLCAAFYKVQCYGAQARGAAELLRKASEKLAAAGEALPPGVAPAVIEALAPALRSLAREEAPAAPAARWA